MRDIEGVAEPGGLHQTHDVTIPVVQTLKPNALPLPAAPGQPGQGAVLGQAWGEERRIRSIVKAASWRLTGTLDTVIVSFFITGNLKTSVSIGGLELFTKMTLYYFHERLWNRLHFGRQKLPAMEYEI
jgi:uncharacterized membrane protein